MTTRTRACLLTTIFRATSPGLGDEGFFKTPTLRNVTKNQLGITKAFMHNGYFKRIEDVVHFYNTRFDGTARTPSTRIRRTSRRRPFVMIRPPEATAAEAIAADCWPVPEFPGTTVALGGLLGNLGLTKDQEAALVAYIKTLERLPHAYGAQHGQVIVDTPRRRCSRGGQVGLPFFLAHPAAAQDRLSPREPMCLARRMRRSRDAAGPQRTKSTSCSAERRIASSMSVRSWSASNSSLSLPAGDTQNSARVGALVLL